MTKAEMTSAEKETRGRRIIERLKMFNRKERDHLMKFALCEEPKAPEISTRLWEIISNGGEKPEPDAMFIGMDYHLNWLYAALRTAKDPQLMKEYDNTWHKDIVPSAKNAQPIKRSQEDVDLLMAWLCPESERLQLVLIEAKLDSSWGSDQFKSKKEMLTLIRRDAESRDLKFIKWQFLLMSPGDDAPSRNEFGNVSGEYDWIRHKGKSTNDLWHEKLPVTTALFRVGRDAEISDKWTVIRSLRATDSNESS